VTSIFHLRVLDGSHVLCEMKGRILSGVSTYGSTIIALIASHRAVNEGVVEVQYAGCHTH
jgi:hypothetical protein